MYEFEYTVQVQFQSVCVILLHIPNVNLNLFDSSYLILSISWVEKNFCGCFC